MIRFLTTTAIYSVKTKNYKDVLFVIHDVPNTITTKNNDLVHISDCVNKYNLFLVFLVFYKKTKNEKSYTTVWHTWITSEVHEIVIISARSDTPLWHMVNNPKNLKFLMCTHFMNPIHKYVISPCYFSITSVNFIFGRTPSFSPCIEITYLGINVYFPTCIRYDV